MKKMVFAVFITLVGFAASAELQPCQDWPTFTGTATPASGLTGYPFTYSFRLSCAPRGIVKMQELKISFLHQDQTTILNPISKPWIYSLPSGDELHQILFLPPKDQKPGAYEVQGVLILRNENTGEARELELPKRVLHLSTNRELVGI